MRANGTLVATWLACLALSGAASAQTMGEMKGTVADFAGAPISGALVEVTSPALIRPRQTATDADGRFRLPILPPGTYAVLARMTGFRDTVVRDVRVSLGETATVPIALAVATAAAVEVSATRGFLETESARMGITVTEKELGALPLGRNYATAASLVGGVGEDGLGPTFSGASSLENSFQIDGLNVTGVKLGGQGKLLPMEFVQEVEVRSGGYEAEYGKALGGNVNVITKSGGNDFHGGVFGYYDGASPGSSDQHGADRAAASLDQLEVPRRLDAGLSLGGPLVRDRLWFFGAYDRARVDQPYQAIDHLVYAPDGVTSVHEGRTETTSADLFALNLTWAPTPSHTVAVSVFGDPGAFHGRDQGDYAGAATSLVGPASATTLDRKTGGTDVSARWNGLLGAFLGEARYGYHEERYRESSPFASKPVIIEKRQGFSQLTQDSGPTGWVGLFDDTYRRNVLAASGSLVVGGHELKAGLDHELENPQRTRSIAGGERILRFLAPDGTFGWASHLYAARTPLNCTVKTDGGKGSFGFIDPTLCQAWEAASSARSDFRTTTASAYLQDTWRPFSNLTVNAGLRYDSQTLTDADGNVRLRSDGQWSPRVSASWDPARNGRSRVFASFGRYYQVIPQDLQANLMSHEYTAYAYNYAAGPDTVNDPALFPYAYVQGGEYVPGGLTATYQDEATAGVEVQAGRGLTFALRGTYRALGRALEDRCDVNDPRAGIRDLVPADQTITASCVLVNPGVGAIGQLNDPSNPACFEDFPADTKPRPCETVHARRSYRGLEAVVQYRPTAELYLRASYVLSRLTGNYEGLVSGWAGNGTFQTDPNWNADFDYVDLLPNDSGRLLNDRTHQLKVLGTYGAASGLTAGAAFRLASGQPLSLYGYVAGLFPYVGFLVPRGSYGEMPSLYQLDLHVQYAFRPGSVSVIPVLDVFNVTNVQRATARNQVYDTRETASQTKPPYTNPTNPDFGKDVAWQAPRLVRLGVRVAF